MTRSVLPLTQVPIAHTVTVVTFAGGMGFQRRLVSMGLSVGSEIKVLQRNPGTGPVLVAVGGTRLGIGHGMARRIMVAPNSEPAE